MSEKEWEKRAERAVEVSAYWFEKFNAADKRIKRLEEAGDCLCEAASFLHWYAQIENWHKAKEAKL